MKSRSIDPRALCSRLNGRFGRRKRGAAADLRPGGSAGQAARLLGTAPAPGPLARSRFSGFAREGARDRGGFSAGSPMGEPRFLGGGKNS